MPDGRTISGLRALAKSSRSVAQQLSDKEAAKGLIRYAEELEGRADALEPKPVLPPAAAVPSGEPPTKEAMAAMKLPATPDPGTTDKSESELATTPKVRPDGF